MQILKINGSIALDLLQDGEKIYTSDELETFYFLDEGRLYYKDVDKKKPYPSLLGEHDIKGEVWWIIKNSDKEDIELTIKTLDEI